MIYSKTKIYFDNCIFAVQKIGGISIVFGEIIKRLKNNKDFLLEIILNGNTDSIIFNDIAAGIPTSNEIKISRQVLSFSPLMRRLPAGSIYHSTYSRYSFQKNIKKIITIHDLGYEKGIMRVGLKRWIHLLFKKIAIKHADAIICVSHNTRKDLENYYSDILSDKVVTVIYNGLSEEYFLEQDSSVKNENSKYIMYVGARHVYKNFNKVVEAVGELENFELLICGDGQLSAEESDLLNKHVKGRYSLHINLTNTELANRYKDAYCLVYPSSYEGFGLPVLEAMACGCPVIACNNSSIPEIAGYSAILIATAEKNHIITAVKSLSDETLRSSLVDSGKINARRFSWETTVQEMSNFYNQFKRA